MKSKCDNFVKSHFLPNLTPVDVAKSYFFRTSNFPVCNLNFGEHLRHHIPNIHVPRCWQGSTSGGKAGEGDEAHFPRWKEDSVNFRNRLGISPSFSPWTGRPGFKGAGLSLTPRVKDLIDCVVAARMKALDLSAKDIEPEMSRIFLDVSQSLQRNAYSYGDGDRKVHKCLTTSSSLYSFSSDRLITPVELLAFQGFPKSIKIPHSISGNDLKTFVGESMSLPCLATVIWALFVHIDFSANTGLPGPDQ